MWKFPNNKSNRTTVLKNIIFAFAAQGVSLVLNIMMSLIVPQILGVKEFSYWQLFLFYSGYSGFFHFGLNDGIYLREGGRDYEKLNSRLIGAQFRVSLFFYCILAIVISVSSFLFVEDASRRFVWVASAIYLPLFNANGFIGYVFQAVNRTRLYSLSVIIDKAFFIGAVFALLLFRIGDFKWFIILYVIGKLFTLGYCFWEGRQIVFTKAETIKNTLKEVVINIFVGINLMFSNIAGTLILGISRFVIDSIWGIVAFGKVSFSLLLSYFFLTFIGQISMVLFPALRQTDEAGLKRFYYISRDLLEIVLPGFLLAYLPFKTILGLWLPQYKESLQYLALLLPLCTYDGKMNMLCTTYFKVLRKEKFLLKINLASLLISLILSLIGGYLFNNIYIVIISMVIAVAFRSIISELYLANLMGTKIQKNLVVESLLVIIFLISSWHINPIVGFIIYFTVYVVFLLLFKKKTVALLYSKQKSYLSQQVK